MEFPSANINDFVLQEAGPLLLKIPLLLLIFLYMLFLFIVLSRIKAFDRVIHISASNASRNLRLFTQIQFVLTISLFIITLVIV